MSVIVLDHLAHAHEVSEVKQWITALASRGVLRPNPNGPGRFYSALADLNPWPDAVNRIKTRIMDRFHLHGWSFDLSSHEAVNLLDATPSFVGMQHEGAYVHEHIDTNRGDLIQFRCTLCVNKATQGGLVVVNGQQYPLHEGDVYCFFSNHNPHGTTPVIGDRPRMSLSFGFLVSPHFQMGPGATLAVTGHA